MFCLKQKILSFIAFHFLLSSQSKFIIQNQESTNQNIPILYIMKIKLFTIPNFLTLANLFCGSLTVLHLAGMFGGEQMDIAYSVFNLIGLSLIFDLLDGMVARVLKINSEIGVQLDSLADMVSFGLVPGLLMISILNNLIEFEYKIFIFSGLLITLFSALRLAKFNVDTEQSTYFKGLATPANTIFIFSLFWIQSRYTYIISENKNLDLALVSIIIVLFCYLLIANLPCFSFKFKGFAWRDHHFKYLFLIVSLILFLLFKTESLAFIIPLYIIISIIFRKKIIHA